MFEIVEAIHKALKIESTWGFVMVIALGAGMVGGFLAWVIDIGYKNSLHEHEQPPKQEAVISKPASEDITANVTPKQQPIPPEVIPSNSPVRLLLQKLIDNYRRKHNGASPSEPWVNKELAKEGYGFHFTYGAAIPGKPGDRYATIVATPVNDEAQQQRIIRKLLVEYADQHPNERTGLLNNTIRPPTTWINERLRQEGWNIIASSRSTLDPSKPPILIENMGSGTLSGVTVHGGAIKNDANGNLINVTVDAKEWFDFLLQEAENERDLQPAIEERRKKLETRWKHLPAKERLSEMENFDEIVRQLDAVKGDPEQFRSLLRAWVKNGVIAKPPQ